MQTIRSRTENEQNGASQIEVSTLRETDLPEAERIFRVAFGRFLGLPEPETFGQDRDYILGRWRASHVAAFGATMVGRLAGSNFATRWGSVAFVGPLTVQVDVQDRGIGKALLAATIDQFDAWGTRHTGLFTFAHSPKHLAVYQKFGFHARFLTAIMASPVRTVPVAPECFRYSEMNDAEKGRALQSAREITDLLFEGLDLSQEIATVEAQGLGDTVLVQGDNGLAAFAVCHVGPRSEAGAGACLIKFGAVRDTPVADRNFLRLLDACEAFARIVGMTSLWAGVNLARHEAYRLLIERGFRTEIQGVAMHRRNEAGYSRPGVYALDDWR